VRRQRAEKKKTAGETDAEDTPVDGEEAQPDEDEA
jgi:hypothetical protein